MTPEDSPIPSRFAALLHSTWFSRLVDFVLAPALILYALWLPPASLGERLLGRGLQTVPAAEGGVVAGPAGAALTVPQGALAADARLALTAVSFEGYAVPAEQFVAAVVSGDTMGYKASSTEVRAAQALPAALAPRGTLYRLQARGARPARATLSLPVPAGLATLEAVDIYAWDGAAWQCLPSQIAADGTTLTATLAAVPELVTVAQRLPTQVAVAVDSADAAAPLGASRVYAGAAELAGDYTVSGSVPDAPTAAGLPALLRVSNVTDGVLRTDILANMLMDPAHRATHIASLVQAARDHGYAGVELDYRGVSAAQRADLTAFTREAAAALHEAGLMLALRMADPADVACDWRALGAQADVVRLSAPRNPAAWAAGGDVDRLLTAATDAVDRRKLELVISALAEDASPAGTATLGYQAAMGTLAKRIALEDGGGPLLAGAALTSTLPDLARSPLQYDADSGVSWFAYRDASGAQHVVTLEDGTSVGRKLQSVRQYALGAVAIEGWAPDSGDPALPEILTAYDEAVLPEPQYALVWTMTDASGTPVQQHIVSAGEAAARWSVPEQPGAYVIQAALSGDGGRTGLVAPAAVPFTVPSLTPTPLATATPTPPPTNTPSPTPPPTSTPDVAATATALANATPTPTSAPATATPALPAAPAPSGSAAGFGYGVQADMITDGNHDRIFNYVQGMGFGWIKQQVEWFRYNPAPGVYDWGALDRIVDGANARGIRILFSVVKAPAWARPAGDTDQGPPADPNTYGAFMREMATRYKGRVSAYEIWNEQNLYYEWGGRGGKINAGQYVQLLAVAYANVKAADPGAIVVSGALTPTGVNDGDIAIDDRVYLEQMYQAGLRNYCDAVGAHPSGYNNPPDADWTSYNDPNEANCKGHPSWFFRSTMEGYRNIMVKYGDGGKRIWATEFGWASVENLGVAPAGGYEYAGQNSEAEQAQYLVRAYQMGRSWGWVGPMFLWNLNFGPVSGAQDEKAAFGIVRPDWSPRPAYDALRDMGK